MIRKIDKKDNSAITLIALVITIVVLIILASVAINLSLGENGLFNKAKTAKEEYVNAQAQEEKELQDIYGSISIATDGTINGLTLQNLKDLIKENQNPAGTVIVYMADNAPDGYLTCEGQEVSRTTYSKLFEAIGTKYGEGDGSSTFNLPDLRGEFLRGTGTNSHTNQGNGAQVGTHQNSTTIPFFGTYVDSNNPRLDVRYDPTNNTATIPSNVDKHLGSHSYVDLRYYIVNKSYTYTATQTVGTDSFSVRPTNTSVLYCIKY